MSRKVILLTLISVGMLAMIGVFSVTRPVEPSTASERCPLDTLLALSPEAQAQCIQEAGGKARFVATVEAMQAATAAARPSAVVITTPRPTKTVATGSFQPPYAERIAPVNNEGQDFRGTQSVWIVGAVQNTEGVHFPLYVYTRENHCGVGTIVPTEGFDSAIVGVPANRRWDCPHDAGVLTITDVTGQTGVISFTTSLDEMGTFNLATEAWTLQGQPWLPPTTTTPQS